MHGFLDQGRLPDVGSRPAVRCRRPDGLPTVDFPIPTPSRRRVPTRSAPPTPRRAPDRRFSYPDAFPTSDPDPQCTSDAPTGSRPSIFLSRRLPDVGFSRVVRPRHNDAFPTVGLPPTPIRRRTPSFIVSPTYGRFTDAPTRRKQTDVGHSSGIAA